MKLESTVLLQGLVNAFLAGSTYTGGAHSNAVYENFLFDIGERRMIGVRDLFRERRAALQRLAEVSRAALAKDPVSYGRSTTRTGCGEAPKPPMRITSSRT
jgi:hypothetical protein